MSKETCGKAILYDRKILKKILDCTRTYNKKNNQKMYNV